MEKNINLKSDTLKVNPTLSKAIRHTLISLAERAEESFSYPPPTGLFELREKIHFYYSLPYSELPIITNGSTEALDLAFESSPPRVASQSRAYFGVWRMLNAKRIDYTTWASIDQLESSLKKGYRTIYLNSNYNGLYAEQMDEQGKDDVAFLARKYNSTVIEDNPLDLLWHREKSSTIMERYENTMYISTLTKIVGPGTRIGFIHAAGKKNDDLKSKKITRSLSCSWITQALVAQLMEPSLLGLIRYDAQKRHARVIKSLAGKGLARAQAGGLYLHVPLPESGMMTPLAARLKSQHVLIDDSRFHDSEQKILPFVRINYCADEEDLTLRGVETLIKTLSELTREGNYETT